MGRQILPFFIFLLSVSGAAAQSRCSAVLTGEIHDEAGNPLRNVVVGIPASGVGTTTDDRGYFRLENLCLGTLLIKVHSLGYQEYSQPVEMNSDAIFTRITLREATQQLSEVVIQDHHEITDHAQNYTSMNETQLAEQAGKSLGESLREISGVNTIQAGPGIFKPVIHGVHSQRILILNYGIRQEGQQWGAEHAPEIDPSVASNIVVIKDASSIKYGTDALGGVIVVNPPELPERAGLSGAINTVLQSNGRSATISGLLEGGLKNLEGWGWRIQGSGKRAGDFHTPDYTLTNTGVRELNYSAATGYHRERFGFEAYFSHFSTTLGILRGTAVNNVHDLEDAMSREVPLYTAPFSYSINEPHQEVQHDLFKVNAHLKSGNAEWRVQYGFQNNHRKEFDFRIGDLADVPALNLKLTTHTLEAEFDKPVSSRQTICVGVSGMFQKNNKIDGIQRIPFIPNFANTSGGVFAVSKMSYAKINIDLGIRYDYRYYSVSGYDYKNSLFQSRSLFHNVSATAGATIALDEHQALKFNVSSAWRPPSVAELYSVGTHQSAASIEYGLLLNKTTNEIEDIDDVNFKTEQALKWVATYELNWKDLHAEISPYLNYIFNYIYLRPDGIAQSLRGPAPAFRYTQTDASFTGIDVAAVWKATTNLNVISRASILRAADESNGDYLVFIPPNRYELNFRYERARIAGFENFYLETGVRYIDEQHRAPRTITPQMFLDAAEAGTDPLQGSDENFDFMDAPAAYGLWHASAGIALKRKKTRYDFRLASENILNASYREYTNRFRYFADEIGRNFTLSVKCLF